MYFLAWNHAIRFYRKMWIRCSVLIILYAYLLSCTAPIEGQKKYDVILSKVMNAPDLPLTKIMCTALIRDVTYLSLRKVLEFLQTYNSRPDMSIWTEGYHYETRTTGSGKNRSTHQVKVRDWYNSTSLTSYIFPFGFIAAKSDETKTVPECIREYHKDTNCLKTLVMEKVCLMGSFNCV